MLHSRAFQRVLKLQVCVVADKLIGSHIRGYLYRFDYSVRVVKILYTMHWQYGFLRVCSVFSTAVPSHTEGVVGLLDAAEGFPYGRLMDAFYFVDESLKQITRVL